MDPRCNRHALAAPAANRHLLPICRECVTVRRRSVLRAVRGRQIGLVFQDAARALDPSQLSGGPRQRVNLARAIAPRS